jgi:predicted nucleic acid-binding protein
MSILVDTNILLRTADSGDRLHAVAVKSITDQIDAGETLIITPQIAAEFWNVATRPVEHNGLGFDHEEARQELARIEGFFSVLVESLDVYAEWKRLVVAYSVTGVQAHDARLVAAMNVYAIRRILTFNVRDFSRYKGIEIIRPG